MAFITDKCTFHELTDDVLSACLPFSCDNDDLDDFFDSFIRVAKRDSLSH